MAWLVSDSPKSWSRKQDSASRDFVVRWTEDETDPVSDPNLAREQVNSYLAGLAQDKTTSEVAAKASPFDPSTHWSLDQHLFGLPAKSLEVDEVEGTEGVWYTATAVWGYETSNQAQAIANAGAGSSSSKATGDDDATVVVSHSLSAGVTGGTVDMLPLRALLTSNTGRAIVSTDGEPAFLAPLEILGNPYVRLYAVDPRFEPGQVHVVHPKTEVSGEETVDRQLVVQGLTSNAPPVNRTYGMEIKGAVSAEFIKTVADAADRGTLNTDRYKLSGVIYEPLELLLCRLDVNYTSNDGTTIDIGFSTSPRVGFEVTTIDGPESVLGYPYPGLKSTEVTDILSPNPGDWYFHTPRYPDTVTVPAEGPDPEVFFTSGHDVYWNFVFNQIVPPSTGEVDGVPFNIPGKVASTTEAWSIHKLWAEANFASLLGTVEAIT